MGHRTNSLRNRRTLIRVTAKITLLISLLAAAALPVRAGELRAGAAAVQITPPLGIPLAGYYSARGADGVADDLFARALALDDGRTRVALVVCDLLSLPRETVEEARRLIEKQCGIPGRCVMISATHTHTGPVLPRKSSRDEALGGAAPLVVQYAAGLPAKIAQSVAEAHARLAPARALFARNAESRASFNRRYLMQDGTVGWNPGKLNPKIIRPAGPIDPEVGVVYFEGAAKEKPPLATYVNFAIHTDNTGGTRISADLPGHLARLLAGYRGPEMVTLFANGTCGDINHLNVRWGGAQKGPEEAYRLATLVGAAVFRAYMDLKPVADETLRVRSEIVSLEPARVTEQEVAAAREIVKQGSKAKFLEQVQAYKALDVHARQGKPWEAEVQVITMGDELAWVGLPGEIFVDLGLSIKAASPFAQTQVAELANGGLGYIPCRSAYAQGNYEVVSTRLAEGSGEKLVESAIKMLAELKAEAAPKAK